jgi:molecular chaperone HscB
MNYFELFEIPFQLNVNKESLPRKYFELSKKYHPDRYINESAEKQAELLDLSASINKALKIFQNEDETIKYALQLKGLLEEEEKYSLPPDFLMQVMEINEQLMDAGDDPGVKNKLQTVIAQLQSEIYEPVKKIIEHYQEGVSSQEELLQVKDYYYKKKYLQRLQQQLQSML